MEADFLRDYQIRLVEQIDSMSWRFFLALVNNLSPYGAVAMHIRAANDSKKTSEDPADDEAAANAFFASVVSV